jgi:hypothetical protein
MSARARKIVDLLLALEAKVASLKVRLNRPSKNGDKQANVNRVNEAGSSISFPNLFLLNKYLSKRKEA